VRILILYDTVYPDFIGGVEHRNYELAEALARRGHEVTLGGLCAGSRQVAPNLRVECFGPIGKLYNDRGQRSSRQALRFAGIVTLLDVRPYDIVETANIPYLHLPILALKCFLRRKPLVVAWHAHWGAYWRDYIGTWLWPVYFLIEWLAAQFGSGVVAVSTMTAGRVAAQRLRGRVAVLPNGIPLARIQAAMAPHPQPLSHPLPAPGRGAPPPSQAELGFSPPLPVGGRGWERGSGGEGPPIFFAGRLTRERRLDLLLRAVQALGPAPGEVLLAIAGKGPALDGLRSLAAELGIAGNVVFHGLLTSDQLFREMARSKVAVQPSSQDSFGLFPLEAMATGLPVVYCKAPDSALPELVRDDREGFGVVADPEAIAAALRRLLTDGGLWQRLHDGALARAQEYDWDHIVLRAEELYRGMLAC
jgi:glycosyltransferase involved in cell wall biosynthesis